MGILEAAIANFICARRKPERLGGLYDAEIREVLARLAVALAIFAAVIAGLQISGSHDAGPQRVADRIGTLQAQ